MVDRERYGERSVDKKNTETGLVEESSYTSGCTNLGRDL